MLLLLAGLVTGFGAAILAVRTGRLLLAGLDERPVILRRGDRLVHTRPRWGEEEHGIGFEHVEVTVLGFDIVPSGAKLLHLEEVSRRRVR